MTEAQGQGQATPEAQATQETQAAEERTFTQADLKKIAANEKREGKSAAINEVLSKAGVESLDDIFSIVEAHKTVEAEMETAADKAEKAKAKAEAKAQEYESRYTNTLREYALRDALRDAEINPQRIKLAMRAADLASLEVDKDGNVSGLEEVVGQLQEDSPEWFGASERPRVNAPQTNGTGVSRPNATDPQQQHANFLAGLLGT